MKHIGSTILLLVSIGLLIVLLPHFQYPLHASASQGNLILEKQVPIAQPGEPIPSLTPRFAIQTVSAQYQTSIPTVIPQSPKTPAPSSTFSLDPIQIALLAEVNGYRKLQGLEETTPNKTVCDFAMLRAQEITTNFSHKGFTDRLSSKTLPYPSYSLVVENVAMNSDQGQIVASWVSSSGHAANMRANTPYGCIGHSGQYYTYEGWAQ